MLIRYATTLSGERKKRADVYTVEEHGISRDRIDPDALQITRRLEKHGHAAYVVGGAVRDLLIDRKPKDFDVVTDATPSQIKRLFKNARVIGKRFRLVHIRFRDRLIEVSTFRSSLEAPDRHVGGNVYGKMEEDVHRRDFSMNALYYSPKDEYIIDYVNGFGDVQKKRIRCLIPLDEIFREDPVRMLRAVKYSASTGFPLSRRIRSQIKKHAALLANIPVSRLTEEFFKILGSGVSLSIFDQCLKLDLLGVFLPNVYQKLEDAEKLSQFLQSLSALDSSLSSGEDPSKGNQILGATRVFLGDAQRGEASQREHAEGIGHSLKSDLFWESKRVLEPLTPPNADIDDSVRLYLHELGYRIEKHRRRHHPPGSGHPRSRAKRKNPK